jgi:hypothetical protein
MDRPTKPFPRAGSNAAVALRQVATPMTFGGAICLKHDCQLAVALATLEG